MCDCMPPVSRAERDNDAGMRFVLLRSRTRFALPNPLACPVRQLLILALLVLHLVSLTLLIDEQRGKYCTYPESSGPIASECRLQDGFDTRTNCRVVLVSCYTAYRRRRPQLWNRTPSPLLLNIPCDPKQPCHLRSSLGSPLSGFKVRRVFSRVWSLSRLSPTWWNM